MKSGKLRFALIGCGAIARKHVAALRRIDGVKVVGAYDVNSDARSAFTERHQIEAFADLDAMMKKAKPDVVAVLTPSGAHAHCIFQAIPYGKHIVVEKPIALRLDDVDRILGLCDRQGLKLFVVQQNRFNPPVRKAREAIEQGRFGKLILGTVRVRWCRKQAYYDARPWRGTWKLDGGVFTNQASHHIDMLLWMMGEVQTVMAETSRQLVNIEAEDTGAAVLRFRNGGMGIVEATTATRPEDLEGSISILGEKGSVEIGGFFMNELKVWNFEEKTMVDQQIWEKYGTVPKQFAWNHTEFYKDVVVSIVENRKALIDGFEGRKSIELINAMYESAESERKVHLRFDPKQSRLGVGTGDK